jgi:hypothetical protein
MKKLVLISLIAALFTAEVTAQNEIDALRYSRLNYSGTARFVSMGGAFGALGADFTTLSHNPAGIGLYRSSEITFTPAIGLTRTEARLDGNFREDSRYNFNIGSVGLVMTNDNVSRNGSGWKNVQFGFGLNRMANFNNRVRIEGDNFKSSFLTGYMENAQGVHPEDLGTFDTRLAYDTELLFVTDSSTWTYGVDKPYGGVNQRKSIDSKGSINEMVFSIGANYNDKVYLGATVGIPYLKYSENATFTETALPDDETVFNSMTRTDFLETSGTGINFKFGLILRATDWLRLGGAIHTPTFYSGMTDEYRSTIRAKYDNGFNPSASANGIYEYELTTPFRAIGSVGIIVGKHGVISADYEFVDYSTARLLAQDYDFYDENEAIRSMYQQANNFRFGTEWRYGALNFRGGYGISANPYNVGTNSAMNTYSAGIGIREKGFYIDLAWVGSQYDDDYYLYNGLVKAAETTTFNNTFMVTLGIKY